MYMHKLITISASLVLVVSKLGKTRDRPARAQQSSQDRALCAYHSPMSAVIPARSPPSQTPLNTNLRGYAAWDTHSSGSLAVGSMVSGRGSIPSPPDPAIPATTRGTVTGGFPPYTITWTRVAGISCNVVSQSGNPTSTATWTTSSTSTGSSTVRMSVTDSATPTPGTAFNSTTISWNAV